MEKQIVNIRVYDKGCIGCKKFKKDIMIAYDQTDNSIITDLFLTQEQAKGLLEELKEQIDYNDGK